MCRSVGNWPHTNKVLNQETWRHNYEPVDKPLAQFCGQVALGQLEDSYDVANEQLVGSSLYQENPWPKVLEHPRRRSVSFDQCQLGQRTTTGESVKKPTELVASDDDLIYHFKGLKCGTFPKRCDGRHVQLTGKEAFDARVWPWDFARRMSWGIIRLLKRKYWKRS